MLNNASIITMSLALRGTCATLAQTVEIPELAAAYGTARDALDMGAMAPEVAAQVLLGQVTIAEALRAVADHQREMGDGAPAEEAEACEQFAADLTAAAKTIEAVSV